jgi:hypothetical protein
MGFKANDPSLMKLAAEGRLIDQQTGRPLGETAPSRSKPADGVARLSPVSVTPLVTLTVTIPGLNLASEANIRGAVRAEIARKKAVKEAVRSAFPELKVPIALPVVVTITRVGTGNKPLDDDNLRRAGKAVRDVISSWLVADDGDRRIRWRYRQRRDWRSAVVIEIRQVESHTRG